MFKKIMIGLLTLSLLPTPAMAVVAIAGIGGTASILTSNAVTKEKKAHHVFMSEAAVNFVALVKRSMTYPDTFHYKDVIYTDKNAICFVYNVNNGFGDYTDVIPVIVLDVKRSNTTQTYLSSTEDWNKHCAGKNVKQTDITSFVNGRV